MKTLTFSSLFAVCICLLLSTVANGAILAVNNGGFESGAGLPGWTISGGTVSAVSGNSAAGTYNALFNQSFGTTLSQSLGSDPGGLYTLQFSVGAGGTGNSLQVLWGGNVIDTITSFSGSPNVYQTKTYTNLAAAGSGNTTLAFLWTSSANQMRLDSISVQQTGTAAVPEPASLAIWGGLGITGLIAARRRKKAVA